MNELLEILHSLHPDVDFASETRLIEAGILDSFDIATLVAEISDSFGILIPAEALIPENFSSAANIYALIQKLNEE